MESRVGRTNQSESTFNKLHQARAHRSSLGAQPQILHSNVLFCLVYKTNHSLNYRIRRERRATRGRYRSAVCRQDQSFDDPICWARWMGVAQGRLGAGWANCSAGSTTRSLGRSRCHLYCAARSWCDSWHETSHTAHNLCSESLVSIFWSYRQPGRSSMAWNAQEKTTVGHICTSCNSFGQSSRAAGSLESQFITTLVTTLDWLFAQAISHVNSSSWLHYCL